ncbi:MAG: hypothetical protein WDM86_12085 [Rhizomicrobium sp.]
MFAGNIFKRDHGGTVLQVKQSPTTLWQLWTEEGGRLFHALLEILDPSLPGSSGQSNLATRKKWIAHMKRAMTASL